MSTEKIQNGMAPGSLEGSPCEKSKFSGLWVLLNIQVKPLVTGQNPRLVGFEIQWSLGTFKYPSCCFESLE